jgi:prephenate dehydrogenase
VSVPARVLVSGTGLIGTSIALALRDKGAEVWLSDADPATARLAADLGAGTVVPDLRDAKGIADVAVLAMPPAAVGRELAYAQECAVADAYTDVASVKALPARQARDLGCDLETYVPGHPLAGRERHGPAAAQADLFLGRTWALCPLPETSPDAVGAVTALAVATGANPVVTDPVTHDRWVALVSHAPHLVAVAMAARLAPPGVSADALSLAGQGLRDVTRIAAGDSALWTQILAANAGPVAEVVAAVAEDLAAAARLLARLPAQEAAGAGAGPAGVTSLLDRGQAGVGRIPGKHGGQPRNFTVVQVVLADRPGELARLFDAAGAAGVNIEDIRLEHSPGLPVGVAELSVRPEQAGTLLDAMEAGGWPVRRLSPRNGPSRPRPGRAAPRRG